MFVILVRGNRDLNSVPEPKQATDTSDLRSQVLFYYSKYGKDLRTSSLGRDALWCRIPITSRVLEKILIFMIRRTACSDSIHGTQWATVVSRVRNRSRGTHCQPSPWSNGVRFRR